MPIKCLLTLMFLITFSANVEVPVKPTADNEIPDAFAGEDRNITPARVNEFVEALRKAGVPNDVHIYDDVQDGFWL